MNVYLLITIILIVFEKIVCENPYRILGIPPYSSIEEVKNRCKWRYYYDYEFDEIQEACKNIMDSRPNEKDGERRTNVAKECINSIISSVICVYIFYFFSMLLYKISKYTLKFSIFGIITFVTIEYFFVHLFKSQDLQYGFSFAITILLATLESIFFEKRSDMEMSNEKRNEMNEKKFNPNHYKISN